MSSMLACRVQFSPCLAYTMLAGLARRFSPSATVLGPGTSAVGWVVPEVKNSWHDHILLGEQRVCCTWRMALLTHDVKLGRLLRDTPKHRSTRRPLSKVVQNWVVAAVNGPTAPARSTVIPSVTFTAVPANARYPQGLCSPCHVTVFLKHQADNHWACTLCAGCDLPSAYQPAFAGDHAGAARQQWLRLLPQSAGGRHARPQDASPGKRPGPFLWKDSS